MRPDRYTQWVDRYTQWVLTMYLYDDDLTTLSPEDLDRVCRWVEDRFVNAVTPLAMELQKDRSGTLCADRTLLIAKRAVKRVLAAVEEVRNAIVKVSRDDPAMQTFSTAHREAAEPWASQSRRRYRPTGAT